LLSLPAKRVDNLLFHTILLDMWRVRARDKRLISS
jgi:hypothetical protein